MIFALWLCMPLSALAEAWVDAGWQQIASGHYRKALSIWQQGVNDMPDHRLLASIGVYARFPYALEQLKQAGQPYGVLIVRHHQHGRIFYYVLSTRQISADRSKRQSRQADLKQAAGINDMLLAVEAKRLKVQPVPTDYFSKIVAKPVRSMKTPATVILAAPASSFSINRFEINGNQHISTDVILMSLRDFYGAGRTRSDLTRISDQLMETYRAAKLYNVHIATLQLLDDTVQITILEK